MRSLLRHPLLVLLALAALLGLAAPMVLGFLGRVHAAFDSFAHFRLHLAIGLTVVALIVAALGQRLVGMLGLALAAGAFLTIWTAQWSSHMTGAAAAQGGRPVYALLQLNLRYDNPEHAAVLSLIARNRPDVVTVNEVSQPWIDAFDRISSAYPYRIVCPFPNGRWGSAILSRRPFDTALEPTCYDRGSMAVAAVDFGGRRVDIAALHLGWPWPFEQRWQIRTLTPVLEGLTSPAILAGDLNAAPWSATVGLIREAGGLTRVGPQGMTWIHRRLPRWLLPLGLAIDNLFTRGDVDVLSVDRLEDVGSDHVPLLLKFSLPGEPADEETTEVVLAAAR